MTSHSASADNDTDETTTGIHPRLTDLADYRNEHYAGRDRGTLKEIGLGNLFRLTRFSRSKVLALCKENCIPMILGNADFMKRLRSAAELSCSSSLDKRYHVDELLNILYVC